MDLPRLRQEGWHAKLNISDEGLDCGESPVTRGCAVAALFLDVCEEVENQRSVDLLETEL